MKGLLTWHQGSILPYTSLWHVIRRAISLNSLKFRDLPLTNKDSSPKRPELIFNDLGAHIDLGTLSELLGEDKSALARSTLSWLNHSWRFLAYPDLRLCKECLNQGFHSSLFSLRLLDECPIHKTPLSSRCSCGQPFLSSISYSYFSTPNCCPCGGTVFFSKETCRRPTLSANETAVFSPISDWLSKISKCFHPDFGNTAGMRLYENQWLEGAERWSDHLNLEYPNAFKESSEHSTKQVVFCSSGRLQNQHRTHPDRGSKVKASSDLHHLREANPSLVTYRAMSKYIRKHVSRRTEYWVRRFARSRDALKTGDLLNKSNEARLAFTEMLWAQTIEQTAHLRRWPYRNTGTSAGSRISCDFLDKGVYVASGNWGQKKHCASTYRWICYHSAEAYLKAVWRAAWAQTLKSAASGIADWRLSEISVRDQMSWMSSVEANDSTKSMFILEADPVGRLPVLSHSSKDERKAKARKLAEASADLVSSACKGPCLTWTETDGWHVREGATPVSGYRTNRVLLKKGVHPKGWLFRVQGQYVLRLIDIRLQVFGETPKEAFEAMRHCVQQYVKVNKDKFSFPRRQLEIAIADRPRNPRRVDYQLRLYRDTKRMGFFEAANIAHIYAESYAAGLLPFSRSLWELRLDQTYIDPWLI